MQNGLSFCKQDVYERLYILSRDGRKVWMVDGRVLLVSVLFLLTLASQHHVVFRMMSNNSNSATSVIEGSIKNSSTKIAYSTQMLHLIRASTC